MNLLSFLKKKEEKPKCDWCKEESEELPYSKKFDGYEYHFCSEECRKKFRKWYKRRPKRPFNPNCPMCRLGT